MTGSVEGHIGSGFCRTEEELYIDPAAPTAYDSGEVIEREGCQAYPQDFSAKSTFSTDEVGKHESQQVSRERVMPRKVYKPHAIATWFINRVERDAGDDITHLKLQKLLYYAQAWHLANYSEPLFDEDMVAWTHGPVVESVWHKYKKFTWESLAPEKVLIAIDDEEQVRFLEAVYRSYGSFSAKALERMTHREFPWMEARGNLPIEAKCTTPINKASMQNYYRGLIDARDAAR